METGVETTESFGVALRAIMEERGVSEATLARMVGVRPNLINRYLHGTRGRELTPHTVATMEKIAQALDMDPEYFLEVRLYRMSQDLARALREGYLRKEDYELMMEGARLRRQAEPCRQSE